MISDWLVIGLKVNHNMKRSQLYNHVNFFHHSDMVRGVSENAGISEVVCSVIERYYYFVIYFIVLTQRAGLLNVPNVFFTNKIECVQQFQGCKS